MSRAFIIMLDSFGVGGAPDAADYGDEGAHTLLHIAQACAAGQANSEGGGRQGPLSLPNLARLGLGGAALASASLAIPGLALPREPSSAYGCAAEISLGKDTQSGHWEMAGVPVLFEWGYFSPTFPSFPESLLNELIKRAELPGVLGNCHASGTQIIQELGEEHVRSGKPIVYTSADSVFQIAAHEEIFGLERLYHVCEIARELVNPYRIGRVIARPFLGKAGQYYRTAHRHDYATPPHAPTLLEYAVQAGHEVIAIGKVADIFAHRGITQEIKAEDNQRLFQALLAAQQKAPAGSICFVNLVDFDMVYGHRRDVMGYAAALEALDTWLPEFEQGLQVGDLAIITADHGCDPTWQGSDHTRECVPILAFGPGLAVGPIGKRESFADIGQTIAAHLGLAPLAYGKAFL